MHPRSEIWRHYHEAQGDRTRMPAIPSDPKDWPESWKTIHYKEYDRLPKITLPDRGSLELPLSATIAKRVSGRNFTAGPLSLETLSQLLYWSVGKHEDSDRRHYPSGGGRYPIEVYPVVLVDNGTFRSGAYHYNSRSHELDVLWERSFSPEERETISVYPWVARASVVLVMTAVTNRTIEKYGERGYRLSLLEAGHIGQNVTLTSAALGVQCCPLGGVRDGYFEQLLDIDANVEPIVYTIAIGL